MIPQCFHQIKAQYTYTMMPFFRKHSANPWVQSRSLKNKAPLPTGLAQQDHCKLRTANYELPIRPVGRILPFLRHSSRGFALPMVLWTIAFLAGLILLVAGTVNSWMEEESHAERVFRARQMALSGLAIGMSSIIKPNDPILTHGDPTSKEGESYSVQINNEAAFINPNLWLAQSDRVIFQRLFEKWGVSEKDQETAIDGLYDWQSPTEMRSAHGAKRAEYEDIGLEGYPPNAPFLDAREMAMVIGFAPVVKAKPQWHHYFSTYNPGKININFCGPDILMDVLGLTPEQAEAFIKICDGPEGIPGTGDTPMITDMAAAGKLIGVNDLQQTLLDKYFCGVGSIRRIDSKGTCNGVTHHIIVIMGDGRGSTMLSWQEQ